MEALNRKERRAIAHGRAFSETRRLYNVPVASGIGKELELAWGEHCRTSEISDHDELWEGTNDFYTDD